MISLIVALVSSGIALLSAIVTIVVDWMVNVDGTPYSGYPLRLHRSTLTEDEQHAFDAHVGVSGFAYQVARADAASPRQSALTSD